jgi:hypothetical protein
MGTPCYTADISTVGTERINVPLQLFHRIFLWRQFGRAYLVSGISNCTLAPANICCCMGTSTDPRDQVDTRFVIS